MERFFLRFKKIAVRFAPLTSLLMRACRVCREDKGGMILMEKTFEIGDVVVTRNVFDAMEEIEEFGIFVSGCLSRYILYDWGDTCDEDWALNDDAVKNGERVMAVYDIPEEMGGLLEEQLWIITEWDRSVTTILFPFDY